ncbi:hypothetical protein GCM10010358_68980 [Streptomyces minutiscleroticus]|uniref:Uncharacterized protein n=1 Tax=Streptomyces minutiscleroticus TaxID=68238 RepID=A0A918U7R9_9ACTN|nr:hypothetical protein GCM10010358_68980 [Streptomyces minutiscleroticus]
MSNPAAFRDETNRSDDCHEPAIKVGPTKALRGGRLYLLCMPHRRAAARKHAGSAPERGTRKA